MLLKYNTYMKFSLNQPHFKAAASTSAKQILKITIYVPKSDSVQIWKWDILLLKQNGWIFPTEKLNNA